MSSFPPHITAFIDQHSATLRDLVDAARAHDPTCGARPLPCPGERVVVDIAAMGCEARISVLSVAVTELARLGYGLAGEDQR